VHARGRDTDIDGTAFEPFEEYQIQIWPASPQPEIVYKTTDRYGAELRRTQSVSGDMAAPQRADDPGAAARLANLQAHSPSDRTDGTP
jgi:hypothetical protein